VGLVVLTAAAAALRATRLDHPMRYDESFTLLYFALPPDPAAWFNYAAPNNHVLHTLLMRLAVWFGGIAPPVVRLPAWIAGVALVPAAGELGRRLGGRALAGLLAAGLVGVSSLLVEYSVNARGYSLVCLMATVAGIGAAFIREHPRRWWPYVVFAAASVLGLYTIPVTVYPIGLLTVLIVVQLLLDRREGIHTRRPLRRLLLCLAAAAVVTALLYLPAIRLSGIDAFLANRFVAPQPLGEVVSELPASAAATLEQWTRDVPGLGVLLIVAGLTAGAVFGWRRRLVLWLLPLVGPVLLAAAAVAQRVVPPPRVWMFLLPLLLCVAGAGLAELTVLFARSRTRWAAPLLILAVVIALAQTAYLTATRKHLISEDPHTLVQAEQIIEDVAGFADEHTALLWNPHVPNWPPLRYYLLLKQGPHTGFVDFRDPACRRVVMIVDDRHSLSALCEAFPQLAQAYSATRLWRRYEGAKVYVALRRGHVQPR